MGDGMNGWFMELVPAPLLGIWGFPKGCIPLAGWFRMEDSIEMEVSTVMGVSQK